MYIECTIGAYACVGRVVVIFWNSWSTKLLPNVGSKMLFKAPNPPAHLVYTEMLAAITASHVFQILSDIFLK